MLRFNSNTNSAQLDSAFGEITRAINDWTPAWPIVAEVIRAIAQEQFTSEGAAGASGPWPALSAAYAKAKARRYPGKPILRASDRLYNSLTGSAVGDSVFESAPLGMTIGTEVEYAAYHQSSAERSRLPRRPILDPVAGRDDARIAAVLRNHAEQLARQAGLEVSSSSGGAAGASSGSSPGGSSPGALGPAPGQSLTGGPSAPLSRGL